jgi:hypothetical protein
MKPIHVFTESQRASLTQLFGAITTSPYTDYPAFKRQVYAQIESGVLPDHFVGLCRRIRADRAEGKLVHVLKNCPVDSPLPELSAENPLADKYRLKSTFIGEVFLEAFAYLLGNPLLSYQTRSNGDFFTDVVSIKRFQGKRTGFTDGDLIYHNDRTSHSVRADFITLLGLRCPPEDLVYTTYVDGTDIISHLSPEHVQALSQKWYVTEVDDLTRESNPNWKQSDAHAVILGDRTLRFQDTLTKPLKSAPPLASEALLEFKDGITKSVKYRHRLENGDLLVFGNQQGLHNRERIEVNNPEDTAKRWLLKTYTFKDKATADAHSAYWANGVYGCAHDRSVTS